MSRQVIRRELFLEAIHAVNGSNMKVFLSKRGYQEWSRVWQFESRHSGMKRAERRKLARAYAARAWREQLSKQALVQAQEDKQSGVAAEGAST